MEDENAGGGMPPMEPREALKGGIVPYLMVESADRASAWYQKVFGARELSRYAGESGVVINMHIVINGNSLMLMDPMPEYGHPLQTHQGYTLHLEVGDVDAWWQRATDAGVEVLMPLELQFWGDRYGMFKDPFGVCWSVATPQPGAVKG